MAEKLALSDPPVEFEGAGSVVVTAVDSAEVAVPEPGSVESVDGSAVPVSATGSVPDTSPGRGTSLGVPANALAFVTPIRLQPPT